MNPEREFTLAIGASLLATSVGLVGRVTTFQLNEELFLIFLVFGILFMMHASGIIQLIFGKLSFRYGNFRPVVGILTDLDPEKIKTQFTEINDPSCWKEYLQNKGIRTKKIRICSRTTRWSLQRYPVIINPYGRFYPEIDEKETVLGSIFDYVENGGAFVNVSDFPFYYASNPKRYTVINPSPYLDFREQVPIYKYSESRYPCMYFYKDPIDYFRESFIKRTNFLIQTIEHCDKIKELGDGIKWAVLVNDKIKAEIICKGAGVNFSPIFSGSFGNGEFIISLISLDKSKSDVVNSVKELVVDRVLKMIGRRLNHGKN